MPGRSEAREGGDEGLKVVGSKTGTTSSRCDCKEMFSRDFHLHSRNCFFTTEDAPFIVHMQVGTRVVINFLQLCNSAGGT